MDRGCREINRKGLTVLRRQTKGVRAITRLRLTGAETMAGTVIKGTTGIVSRIITFMPRRERLLRCRQGSRFWCA